MSESKRQARKGAPAGEADGPRLARAAGARAAWLWALMSAVAFAVAGLLALRLGFRAISDDDYARVLLSQRFARAPRLDPTGSSWLPFPFWVTGGLMRAFGPTLEMARAVALAWASASGLLLWAAGRASGLSPAGASLGALLPLASLSLAPFAAAPVPELPTAALVTYGVVVACFGGGRAVVAGGAALFAACLSRYEAWPFALYAALVLAARAALARRDGVAASTARAKARHCGVKALGLSALLALAGPVAWLIWNHLAHGDALSFARRVASYHASVARAPSPAEAFFGHPAALAREAPGLVLSAALAAACGRGALRRWAPVLGAGLMQLLALGAAELRGGAPTHHPERALMAVGCLLGLVVAGEGERAWGARAERAEGGPGGGGFGRWLTSALALAVVAGFAWRLRAFSADWGPSREEDLALGGALFARVGPGERVLMAPSSYGYIATLVAFGRPDDVTALVPRAVDPRSKADDPFESAPSLVRAAGRSGARWVLAAGGQRPVAEAAGLRGGPLSGPWWLYDAEGALRPSGGEGEKAPPP